MQCYMIAGNRSFCHNFFESCLISTNYFGILWGGQGVKVSLLCSTWQIVILCILGTAWKTVTKCILFNRQRCVFWLMKYKTNLLREKIWTPNGIMVTQHQFSAPKRNSFHCLQTSSKKTLLAALKDKQTVFKVIFHHFEKNIKLFWFYFRCFWQPPLPFLAKSKGTSTHMDHTR